MALLAAWPGHSLHRERIIEFVCQALDRESANGVGKAMHALHHALERARTARGGDLLSDGRYEDWRRECRVALSELGVRLLRGLVKALESSATHQEAAARLHDLPRADRAREVVRRRLMRLPAQAGARKRAVPECHSGRGNLQHELDLAHERATVVIGGDVRPDRVKSAVGLEELAHVRPAAWVQTAGAPSHIVGRRAELDGLSSALAGVAGSPGGSALLRSDAGMGKTRSVHNFALAAVGSGAAGLLEGGGPGVNSVPDSRFLGAIEGVVLARPPFQGNGLMERSPTSARRVPSRAMRAHVWTGVFVPGEEHAEMTREVVRLLAHLGRTRAVAVLPGDREGADRLRFDLLLYLARLARARRWFLAATVGDHAVSSAPEVPRMVQALRTATLGLEVELPFLSREVSDALLASMLPGAQSDPPLDGPHGHSGGNPQLIEGVIAGPREARHLVPSDARWRRFPGTAPSAPAHSRAGRNGWSSPPGPEAQRVLGLVGGSRGPGVALEELRTISAALWPSLSEGALLHGLDGALELPIVEETTRVGDVAPARPGCPVQESARTAPRRVRRYAPRPKPGRDASVVPGGHVSAANTRPGALRVGLVCVEAGAQRYEQLIRRATGRLASRAVGSLVLGCVVAPSLGAAAALVALPGETALALLVLSCVLSLVSAAAGWGSLDWVVRTAWRRRQHIREISHGPPPISRLHDRLQVWHAEVIGLHPSQPAWAGLLPAALTAALAGALVWLAWHRPGPWEAALSIALSLCFLARGRRWSRWSGRTARRALDAGLEASSRRIVWLALLRARWGDLPAATRAALLMLVSLSVLCATEFAGIGFFLLGAGVAFTALNRLIPRSVAGATSPGRNRVDCDPAALSSAEPVHAPHPEVCSSTPVDAPPAAASDASGARKLQPRVALLGGIGAVAWIAYAHPGPILLVAVLVLGLVVPFTTERDRSQAMTMVLAVGVAVASVDYISWRLSVTNWTGWWIALPLLWAELLGAVHVLGFQFTVWPWPEPELLAAADPTRHPIFIFIPTVDEGLSIVRPTVDGALSARRAYQAQHPHAEVTIVVCNDGRAAGVDGWHEIDEMARRVGVLCVTRRQSGGAKAGNLENARQHVGATGDALVIIFDADQVPAVDFLLKTVTPFADPAVGWVQTGQYYSNLDNPVSRWADDQQALFYNLLCPGKARLNSAFICGTNVVIRAAALDEIGGLPQNSVTEDFAASIDLHPRWRSIYIPDVLATGLGPLDIPSYLKQQRRWALGTLGVLRSHWREIFLPRRGGLTVAQRLQYCLACTHYLCGLRDFIYVVSPVMFIATAVPAVRSATLSQYLWHFIPYGILGMLGIWYAGREVTGLRGVIIGFGSFPALIASLLTVLSGRRVGFTVTSKARRSEHTIRHACLYATCAAFCLGALVWSTQVRGEQRTSLFISVLWIIYSLVQLSFFSWLIVQDSRFHAAAKRAGRPELVTARRSYPARLLGRSSPLRPVGNASLAVVIALPLLAGHLLQSLPVFRVTAPTPFVISREALASPYLGVSVPAQLLKRWPATLEQRLGVRFALIGRTQTIHDRFDTAWAERLAARGAQPWITIEFGVFGRDGSVPLDASLVAIYNGVDDRDLRRWAQEIRAFKRPVYLTILRHTDRNWSLSSAVAHGGIPEDAPQAWMHVQSIFRTVGTTNVAWVWAPADPIHDQQYAPAPSTITMVLQSFINYPHTQWGDPKRILAQLERRYPRMPLMVEAGVAGPPLRRAGWLARLATALRTCRTLYAFLYHEGGPALRPGPAEIKTWSATSDPASLAATRAIMTSLAAERRAR